jgi:hypothetical protein
MTRGECVRHADLTSGKLDALADQALERSRERLHIDVRPIVPVAPTSRSLNARVAVDHRLHRAGI